MARTQAIVDVLGGRRVIGAKVRTVSDLALRLRSGLPFAALDALAQALGVSREIVARTLQLPARTVARRKAEGTLHPDEADRVCRLARVFAHAIEVLGDRAKAAAWLTRPNRALAGSVPLELLDTDLGVQQVNETLGRVEHGIFA